MRKVLVTGATGFIGNYVVEELLHKNLKVIATSIDKQKAERADWYPKVLYLPLDLSRLDRTQNYFNYFNQPDLLIHLAWEGLPNYQSAFHVDTNLPRHISFLSGLVKNGLRDLSVTGTCFEYGMLEGSLDEEMEVQPANPYAIAKDSLRRSLQQLKIEHDFVFRWIRLFYMFGKGQNPNSLFSQLDKALENGDKVFNMSGGEQLRDYLPVEKVAENIVAVALQREVAGIINCCSGFPVSVKQMMLDYLAAKKADITLNTGYYPYNAYEPMAFWGSNKKLKSIIK